MEQLCAKIKHKSHVRVTLGADFAHFRSIYLFYKDFLVSLTKAKTLTSLVRGAFRYV